MLIWLSTCIASRSGESEAKLACWTVTARMLLAEGPSVLATAGSAGYQCMSRSWNQVEWSSYPVQRRALIGLTQQMAQVLSLM